MLIRIYADQLFIFPKQEHQKLYLANTIKSYGKTITILDQYGIDKFGETFEVVPRTLLDNSGYNVHDSIDFKSKVTH